MNDENLLLQCGMHLGKAAGRREASLPLRHRNKCNRTARPPTVEAQVGAKCLICRARFLRYTRFGAQFKRKISKHVHV